MNRRCLLGLLALALSSGCGGPHDDRAPIPQAIDPLLPLQVAADVERRGPLGLPLGRWIGPWAGQPEREEAVLAEARRVDAATARIEDGAYEAARTELLALRAAGSRHPQVPYLLALAAWRQDDLAGAAEEAERALAAAPLWVEPRILLAQSYARLKRHALAGSVFADIDRLAPQSPWGPWGMASCAAAQGDHGRAAAEADRAIGRDPRHAPSLRLRAALARLAGDERREQALLIRLLALDPGDAAAHLRLGLLALAGDRRIDARSALERSWELAPGPESAQALAELAQREGDEVGARRWRQRAGR